MARRTEVNRAIYGIQEPTGVELCGIVCSGLAERFAEGLEALEAAS